MLWPGTPHFSRDEMTVTRTGLLNVPADDAWLRMHCLAAGALEPWRARLSSMYDRDVPIQVNSWYRSPAVNKAVGGHRSSQHQTGDAVDVEFPQGVDRWDAFELLWHLAHVQGLCVDRAIFYERKSHIHLTHRIDREPRRIFQLDLGDGTYQPYEERATWRPRA